MKDTSDLAAVLVSVVDDDESMRESLPDLVRTFGFSAAAFSSAEEFLQSGRIEQTRCLILDVNMPGMTGPALMRELWRRGARIPVVLITAHADTVRPDVIAGAAAFLVKPFNDTALCEALRKALGL
jgi:FixJ family two-component response regulator